MLCISCAIILTRKKADERNAAIRPGCGTARRTHSVTHSTTLDSTAAHIILIRVYDEAGNVIEMHEQALRSALSASGCHGNDKPCIGVLVSIV